MSEITTITRDKLLKAFGGNLEIVKVFENLTQVVGGDGGDSLTQVTITANQALAATDALSLGVYRPAMPSHNLSGIGGVSVGRDAAGPVVSIDLAFLAAAIKSLAPRPEVARREDDAGAVIASRVFGKR